MRANDDYKFSPVVYVDDKQVCPRLPYATYQTALDAASGIVDAEWSKGQKLEVFIDLMALRYKENGEILSWWNEKQLYHLKIDEKGIAIETK